MPQDETNGAHFINFAKKNGFVYDNRRAVPYNEFILLKYDCPINTEWQLPDSSRQISA